MNTVDNLLNITYIAFWEKNLKLMGPWGGINTTHSSCLGSLYPIYVVSYYMNWSIVEEFGLSLFRSNAVNLFVFPSLSHPITHSHTPSLTHLLTNFLLKISLITKCERLLHPLIDWTSNLIFLNSFLILYSTKLGNKDI